MKIAVIGAGSWGTALSQVLALNGHEIMLWARKEEVVQSINTQHVNPRYLSDVILHPSIKATMNTEEVLGEAQAVVVVTPSALMRQTAQSFEEFISKETPIIICSKGIEEGSGLLPIEVFEAELGNAARLAVLAGPNHAEEVILGIPSATVIASSYENTARFFQDLFVRDEFRTYISDDVCGVELCAAFKNIIAIAVGISYGMGFGDNTAALLMTRGVAEMSRLVQALGGQAITCMGLAGVGDMIATCTSKHSRNQAFGRYVAKGRTLAQYQEDTHMVVEGALACRTVKTLADSCCVELPITDMVRAVVWEGVDVRSAADLLTHRPLATEFYGI